MVGRGTKVLWWKHTSMLCYWKWASKLRVMNIYTLVAQDKKTWNFCSPYIICIKGKRWNGAVEGPLAFWLIPYLFCPDNLFFAGFRWWFYQYLHKSTFLLLQLWAPDGVAMLVYSFPQKSITWLMMYCTLLPQMLALFMMSQTGWQWQHSRLCFHSFKFLTNNTACQKLTEGLLSFVDSVFCCCCCLFLFVPVDRACDACLPEVFSNLPNLVTVYTMFFFLFSAFATRLFSVLRFESVIHEFDPYFNYRTTRFLAEEGFYNFHNWFDDRAWYPLGRIIGGTIYPGTDALTVAWPDHHLGNCTLFCPYFSLWFGTGCIFSPSFVLFVHSTTDWSAGQSVIGCCVLWSGVITVTCEGAMAIST